MKRTFAGALLVGAVLGYALLSGAAIDLGPEPTDDPPRTHDVQVRDLGDAETPVTVTVLRNSEVVLQRQVTPNASFTRVLRLQGSGDFTVVVSTAGDSTSVDVDRPPRYQSCSGDINLQFSVESEDVYLSTNEEPGRCIEA